MGVSFIASPYTSLDQSNGEAVGPAGGRAMGHYHLRPHQALPALVATLLLALVGIGIWRWGGEGAVLAMAASIGVIAWVGYA